MSEGSQGAAPRRHGLIRSPQDFWGGIVLIGVALFALWAGSDLPGMRGFAFGPGTAPRLFAYGLMGLGFAVMLTGVLTDGPPEEPFSMSGPLGGAVLVVVLIPMTIYANRLGKLIPGVAPDVLLAALETLVIIGLAILVARYAPRGPVFITAATLIFADFGAPARPRHFELHFAWSSRPTPPRRSVGARRSSGPRCSPSSARCCSPGG